MLSPTQLTKSKIPYCRCVQNPREFMITLPRSYHCGWNKGWNISCLAIQWGMICNGIFHVVATAGTSDYHGFTTIKLGIVDLIRGDFAAAAVLISFGAVFTSILLLHLLLQLFLKRKTQR